MKIAAHGVSAYYSNAMTQTTIAGQLGYDAMEYLADHLLQYQDNGCSMAKLREYVESFGMTVSCINALQGIDRWEGEEKDALLKDAQRLVDIADELHCPVIQLNPSYRLLGMPEQQALDILCENIGQINEIGMAKNVRFQIEAIAHTGLDTLQKAKEIVHRLKTDNIGYVVDFWHIHASEQPIDEIRALTKEEILDVHLCDGRRVRPGETWDERVLRAYYPGEGDVPIAEMVEAVKSTGYDGFWSAELLYPKAWEEDLREILLRCKQDILKDFA